MRDQQHVHRRNMWHYQPPGAVFHVVIRLAHSLPRFLVDSINAGEFDLSEKTFQGWWGRELFTKDYYQHLMRQAPNLGYGPQWLKNPDIAELAKEALHYRDRKVYRLYAYSIMPNHIHILFRHLAKSEDEKYPLAEIIRSYKWYVARNGNKILGREGAFWGREYFDEVVTNRTSFINIARYITENPVKAYLAEHWMNWPHTWVHPALRKALG
ncbi:MAG: transposase [Bacteroidota bacterium]